MLKEYEIELAPDSRVVVDLEHIAIITSETEYAAIAKGVWAKAFLVLPKGIDTNTDPKWCRGPLELLGINWPTLDWTLYKKGHVILTLVYHGGINDARLLQIASKLANLRECLLEAEYVAMMEQSEVADFVIESAEDGVFEHYSSLEEAKAAYYSELHQSDYQVIADPPLGELHVYTAGCDPSLDHWHIRVGLVRNNDST